MGTLPSRDTPGAALLRRLAAAPSQPRVVGNFLRLNAPVGDATLEWIAQNLDLAIEEIRREVNSADVEARLEAKLLDAFPATFAEVRCVAQLTRGGVRCLVEPDYPAEGPDLRAMVDGISVGIEVTLVADDAGTVWRDRLLQAVKSSIPVDLAASLRAVSIHITVTDDYAKDGRGEKALRTSVVNALRDVVGGTLPLPSTVYYSAGAVTLAREHHRFRSGPVWDNISHPSNHSFDAVVVLDGMAENGPFISMAGDVYIEDPERLRKKILKKRRQLTPGACNIVVLDIANDSFASYGLAEIVFGSSEASLTTGTDGSVTVEPGRKGDGAFNRSSRISALVTTGWGIMPNILANKFELVSVGGHVLKNADCAVAAPQLLLDLLRTHVPFPGH